MKVRALILICFLLLILNCAPAEKYQSKVIVALLDLSESTNQPQIREKYAEAFREVLGKIADGDSLVVALITERSIRELEIPIKEDFPAFKSEFVNLLEDEEQVNANAAREKKIEALAKQAEALLQDKTRKIIKTDIMSSLQVAERVFGSYKQPRKALIIMSDMLEDSADNNFEKEVLTEKRSSAIMAKEKGRNRIPDLKDVKVYIVGAQAPTLDQYYGVQAFWLNYFKECGAIAQKKDYGSGLVTFEK